MDKAIEEHSILREENRRLRDENSRYKRIVETLEAKQERYELAINGASEGLWDWNLITNEIYFAPRWKLMLGYGDDELPNVLETWSALVHPDDLVQAEEAIEASIANPKIPYENVHRLRHKDGHYLWNLDRGQVLFDNGGKAVRMIGFHTDITQQHQMSDEIRNTQEIMIAQSRHAAMGEMIGMIAHQWRQPLTIISMVVDNVSLDIDLETINEEACRAGANEILTQVNYLSKTIDDFRDFFRPDKQREEIKIIDIMNEAYSMIESSFKNNNIEVEIINQSQSVISLYSRELLQVIINLLKNAKEALLSHTQKNRFIRIRIYDEGEETVAELCDNGGGIAPEVLPHIYEPYFSTKDEKTGTGLGLYMSKTIIEKHLKGTITVQNRDNGVCFTIRLPKKMD